MSMAHGCIPGISNRKCKGPGVNRQEARPMEESKAAGVGRGGQGENGMQGLGAA